MECSRANGGQVSVCNSATWNTWSNVWKGVKWMGDPAAPLKIRPWPSAKKLTWLAGFLRHTVNGTQQRNTIRTVEMGLQSRDLYRSLAATTGIQFNQSDCGLLSIYTNQKSFEVAQQNAAILRYAGLDIKPLSKTEVLTLDPALVEFSGIVGGLHTPSDFVGDTHLFTKNLLQYLRSSGNAEFRLFQVEDIGDGFVTGAAANGEETTLFADAIVLASGYRLADHARMLGEFLNIYPVKGYSITIDIPSATMAPRLSLLDDDRKIVASVLGNQFRVAGTAELDDTNVDIRRERIDPLLMWVRRNFPRLDQSSFMPWACLRPMASDMMPITRQSKNCQSVWFNGGHGHLGWTLGAATAYELAKEIDGSEM